MKNIRIINENRTLQITQNESKWQLLSVKGINPPMAQINTTSVVGGNGSIYGGSRITDRQLVLTLKINGNCDVNKLELYEYLSTNEKVKFMYQTERLNVWTEGYVAVNDCDIYSQSVLMQVTINCPYPFFKDVDVEHSSNASMVDCFEFLTEEDDSIGYFNILQTYDEGEYGDGIPFSEITFDQDLEIENNMQLEVGMIFQMDCLDTIVNPLITNIYNPNEYFGINYTFNGNDMLFINTNFGKEEVYVIRDGNKINLINYLISNVTWLQLKKGLNSFRYEADSGDEYIVLSVEYTKEYKGV